MHARWYAPGRIRLAGTMLSRCTSLCASRFGPHMPTDLRCQELPIWKGRRKTRLRRHPNVGSLRLLPCPHLQGLPRDMLTEPLCRTDPGLPVSHLRTPRCLPRMWIWRMVAGVRKSLRETMSCFWGVRNLPWTRALGYPRGMTRLGRPEDAPFKGSREKLKRIGGPQGAPWDVLFSFFYSY